MSREERREGSSQPPSSALYFIHLLIHSLILSLVYFISVFEKMPESRASGP